MLATIGLVLVGMASSTWWGPHIAGTRAWQLPDDLWGTLVAARRLLHLELGGLYTQPTGLVAFPGAALVLVPIAAVIDAAGLSLASPGAHNAQPAAWLAAGPYEILLSAVVLFAADSVAERLGASRPKRALLAGAGAVALWNVSVRWGHPEDAVAVALLLYGVLALSEARTSVSAWTVGAAVAVQPLVLLAVPILVVLVERQRLAGFLTRAAAPAALLVGIALSADWQATSKAVVDQPNWPGVDHPTPFVAFAPHLGHGAVAAGPSRGVAVIAACLVALVVERREPRATMGKAWGAEELAEVLWWIALALALRCVFESVMVAYYVWPVLAVALVCSSTRWPRLVSTSVVAAALTFVSQASWHGRWTWWGAMVAGIATTLVCAREARRVSWDRLVWAVSLGRSQGIQDTRLRSST